MRPAAEVGTVRETEGLRERDNKSYWDLKGKGENKKKKNCPIHGEGGQTAAAVKPVSYA